MLVFYGVILLEAITLAVRFKLGVSARSFYAGTSDKLLGWYHIGAALKKLAFGYRIHHGYIGLAIWLIGCITTTAVVQQIGLILFWSDVLHHSILWLFTGDAEFDITHEQAEKRARKVES